MAAARSTLAVLALAATAMAGRFDVSEDKLVYVSGQLPTGVALLDDVEQAAANPPTTLGRLWHDVSSQPLVVQLSLTHSSTAANGLNTPTASFVRVSGTQSTVGTSVTVSPPRIERTFTSSAVSGGTVSYNITFGTTTYGVYTITYNCDLLEDKDGNTGQRPSSPTDTDVCQTKTVQIGYTPGLALLRGGASVTPQWLDPTATDMKLQVTPGRDYVFASSITASADAMPLAKATGTSPWALGSNLASASTPLALDDTVAGWGSAPAYPTFTHDTARATALTYGVVLDSANLGQQTVYVRGGAFPRSDGVGNVEASFVVKTGWVPLISFEDDRGTTGSTADDHVDDTAAANTTGAFWFKSGASNVKLVIAAPTATPALTLNTTTVPAYGIAAGNLLAGMAALPGSAVKAGGITAGPAVVANGKYTYALNILQLTPGTYVFNIPQGVLGDNGAYSAQKFSCASTAILRIGYDARISITTVSDSVDRTSQWLDPGTGAAPTAFKLTVAPTTGTAFDGAVVSSPSSAATAFILPSTPATTFTGSPAATAAGVDYGFTLDPTKPGAEEVAVVQGKFARRDGVMNTFGTFPIRVGFGITAGFVDSLAVADGWYASATSAVNLTIAMATGSSLTLNATVPAYGLAAGQLFFGAAALPGAAAKTGGITSSGGIEKDSKYHYALDVTGLPAGLYTFTIPQGTVRDSTNKANFASTATLRIGFVPDVAITDDESKADVTALWIDNAGRDFTLTVGPGLGYTYDASVLASVPAATAAFGSAPVGSSTTAADMPTFSSANPVATVSSIKYALPRSATVVPGTWTFNMPAGTFTRSDGLLNAPLAVPVRVGFVPTVSFTDGTNVDKWYAAAATTLKLTVAPPTGTTLSTTVPAYSLSGLFNGLLELPGSAGRTGGITGGTGAVVSGKYEYALTATGIVAGQYAFEIPAGAISDSGTVRNAAASGYLKIGFTPVVTVTDELGADISTEYVNASRTASLTVTLTPSAAELANLAVHSASNGGIPTWASLVNAATAAALPVTADGVASFNDATFSVSYRVPGWLTAGSYNVALDPASAGAICNGKTGTAQICNAPATATGVLKVGFSVSGEFSDETAGSQSNSYHGQLDADGKITDVSAGTSPIPALTNKLRLNFYGTFAAPAGSECSWDFLVSAPSNLPAPSAVDCAVANTIKFTWADATGIAPGTYDVMLKPGVLAATAGAAKTNARTIVRLIMGFDLRFMTADTRLDETEPAHYSFDIDRDSAGASTGSQVYRRSVNGPFVTSASDVIFRIYGTGIGGYQLTELLEDVLDASGKSVKFALTGNTATAHRRRNVGKYRALDFMVGITGLADGTYTFKLQGGDILPGGKATATPVANTLADRFGTLSNLRDQSVTLIVDRSRPAAADATYDVRANGAVLVGTTARLALPGSLFSSSGSPDANLRISAASEDDRGLALVPGPNNATALLSYARLFSRATGVRGPAGSAVFTLTATNEAGASATARLTVPVTERKTGALTAIDSRGVQSRTTLLTGGGATRDSTGALPLSVIVDFEAPVVGVTAAALVCKIGSAACGASATAVSPANAGTTGSKRYTWTITIPAADVTRVANFADRKIVFSVNAAGLTTAAEGHSVAAPAPVSVQVDTTAPSTPGTFTSELAAVAGTKFTVTLPLYLFRDSVSTQANIQLVAASPSTTFGLSFAADKQGVAVISGVPTGVPPGDGLVYFDITAADEAGNRVTARRAVAIRILAAPTAAAALTMTGNLMQFKEGGSAVAIDAAARFTWSERADKVLVTLVSPEAADTAGAETLTSTTSGATYAVDASTGEGVMSYAVSSATLSATDVQNFLRTVRYSNTRAQVNAGQRTIRVDVVKDGGIVATASRILRLTPDNDAPTVTLTSTAPTWTESGAAPVKVYSAGGVAIADADDTDLTAASLEVLRADDTAVAPAFAKCDGARDALRLPADYLPGASPKVVGTWSPTACTLTLKPAEPLPKVSLAEMVAALEAVVYTNRDAKNPTNGVDTSAAAWRNKRRISLSVEDNGSGGKLPDKARSTAVTLDLTLTPQDDAPVIDSRAAFGDNGFLSSTDPFANLITTNDGKGVVKQKKFVLALPSDATTAGTTVFRFPLDLTKAANGRFAGGAITDVDTYDPIATAPTIVAISGPTTISTPVALADLHTDSATLGAFGTATDASGGTVLSGFSYSTAAPSTLTLVAKNDADASALGEYKFTFTYTTGVTIDFGLDVRRKGCTLEDALNFVGAANVAKYYPDNALCNYPATDVEASSGRDYPVSRGGYDAFKTSLNGAAADLQALGTSKDAQVAALKEERARARGAFNVFIAAGSLASRGSMPFQAGAADSTTRGRLPAVKDSAKEAVDLNVAVRLQPSGTTFSKPVRVCLYVGDTPSNQYRVLAIASQRDAGDQSKGYNDWELMSDQSFNPATGEVCGFTDHFSVVAPITRNALQSPTVSKAHLMGGSCPNQCSNRGFCRQEGKCACFAGFTGYDCSLRTCPSAESWGEDLLTTHSQSECAGRGVCDRASGQCKCFDGFEGAACERSQCPNSCSGHGKCRKLSELPGPQAAGYTGWEAERIQRCVCDGGYTGADCSQRVCPFGDDPETVCAYERRQVQRLSLAFETDPTNTGLPNVDTNSDEFALRFTTAAGSNFTTPVIADIWDGTTASAAAIRTALRTLPEFAVTDVAVSPLAATDASSLRVQYDITMTGSANTGNEKLLSCPANTDGIFACRAPGCRPMFQQLRIFSVPNLPSSVQISDLTVLRQPAALPSANTAATPSVWGVETTLVINKYTVPGVAGTVYTYKFVNTAIYGSTSGTTSTGVVVAAEEVQETPIPPPALRTSVQGPYGLLVDLGSDQQLGIDLAGTPPFSYTFKWRLPTCTVTQVAAADVDLEKAECSNRGLCNRRTAECECFAGYAGTSCSQQTVFV